MGHVRPSKPHETLFSVKVNAQSVKVNDPMRHDDPLLEAFTLTGDHPVADATGHGDVRSPERRDVRAGTGAGAPLAD